MKVGGWNRGPGEAIFSSEKQDWCTPIAILRMMYGAWPEGVFLDPCSNISSIVNAKKAYTIDDNGLVQDWSEDLPAQGLIYVNPPYGKALDEWATVIATKHAAMRDAGVMHAIVTLVPARTDTQWFRSLLRGAEGIIFLEGRVRFLGGDASAPFPSCFVVHQYGSITKVQKMADDCRQKGALVFNA